MKRINCPYLGLADDPTTALNFPSEGNFCHHVRPTAPIKNSYQEQYCLSESHVNCPIYRAVDPRPLPLAIASPTYLRSQSKRTLAFLAIPVMLAGVVAAGVLWSMLGSRGNPIESEWVPLSGGNNNTSNNSGLFNQRLTPSATPFLPTTSFAPQKIMPANCVMPDGWMTYVVNPTDSLVRLSVVYGASVDALQKANCMGNKTVLLPGQVIFVPFVPTETPNATLALPIQTTLQATNKPPLLSSNTPLPIQLLPPSRTPVLPTPTDSPVPTNTPAPTNTLEPSNTPIPTNISVPTNTPPAPTNPPPPTNTRAPTIPPAPTDTIQPSNTPVPPPTVAVEPTKTKKPKPVDPTPTNEPPPPTVAPTLAPTAEPVISTPTIAPASDFLFFATSTQAPTAALPTDLPNALVPTATQTVEKRIIDQILSLFDR